MSFVQKLRMHGREPKLKDIVLVDIEDLILPANLLSDEDLSAEAELVTTHNPYKIVACCACCGGTLKFHVAASPEGIRGLEQLLLGSLSFICTGCSKSVRDGR